MKTKIDFSAGGVIWDLKRRRVLLIRVENLSGQRVWTFPKGHPDPGETVEAAAVREVREETGWACSIVRPLGETTYFFVSDGTRYRKTVRWFLMAPETKVGRFDPAEVLGCRWVSFGDATARLTYETDRAMLGRIDDAAKGPSRRRAAS